MGEHIFYLELRVDLLIESKVEGDHFLLKKRVSLQFHSFRDCVFQLIESHLHFVIFGWFVYSSAASDDLLVYSEIIGLADQLAIIDFVFGRLIVTHELIGIGTL